MSQPIELAYGRQSPRRRSRRRAVLIALVCLVTFTAYRGVQLLHTKWQAGRQPFLDAQQRCWTYTPDPAVPVYAEGKLAQNIMTAQSIFATKIDDYAVYSVPPLQRLQEFGGRGMGSGQSLFATLFLHERHTSNGDRRLVAITLGTSPRYPGAIGPMDVHVTVADPMGRFLPYRPKATTTRQTMGKWPPLPTIVTFYPGEPDPANPSRFSIAYQIGDYPGLIDGVLNNNQTVTLTPVSGPLAKSPTTQAAP
jgi:hypothetical protein